MEVEHRGRAEGGVTGGRAMAFPAFELSRAPSQQEASDDVGLTLWLWRPGRPVGEKLMFDLCDPKTQMPFVDAVGQLQTIEVVSSLRRTLRRA